ncbi:hypothetical protein SPBR_07347 [Sporothrix brasiliensis 5110]|uniref:Protein kinase domain-containing protein n=1 Tax=Sporothrix brasiliensis 5110 TaxID=1398154 RepID=A0A0C2EQU3_9PEZI|nr:uncharacterized protein SPBR_07347 [Sporothrix brasiliensis 5110]KIH88699.1 hypothetical protein SPBR_07347 [Sporothrix brasiliensis 5110]
MAPITRSQSKKQGLSREESTLTDTDKSGQAVEVGVNITDKCVTETNGVTGPNMGEADLNTAVLSSTDHISAGEHPKRGPTAAVTENPGFGSRYIPQQHEWSCWESEIRETFLATTDDPNTLFINSNGAFLSDGSVIFYYSCNGEFFLIRDNGQPWRWPAVKVDPATLGLPYDPETNAEDAALELTMALPQSLLRNDAVFIKEFFDKCVGSTYTEACSERWLHEVRMLELLARKHPHPNFVRYLGCRVIEVPGDNTAAEDVLEHAGQTRKRVQKRITGIVLEKLQHCMSDYDPDDANWSRILEPAIFLKRLEAAVLYLHSVGLAHNDLKPGNVMVRADGQPVLIDFESCGPPGTQMYTCGTRDWKEDLCDPVSSFENDLYALRLFRERIGDKEARDNYFFGH